MSRITRSKRSSRSALNSAAHAAAFEPLESRELFSAINWVNEGTSDNFGVYGASASVARTIVHRAINYWQQVITNFNHTGGFGNSLDLTVTAAGGGIASGGATAFDPGGRPVAGGIAVGTGATTHHFDLNSDDGEFTDFVTPFAAFAPSVSRVDFYTTMLHEIGHVVGYGVGGGLAINSFITNTGIDDPFSGDADPFSDNPAIGNLLAINVGGGPIEATFTNADSGHLWEGISRYAATTAAGLPSHPNDLMNPGRSLFDNERFLITDSDANLLSQVYGYSVQLPSQIDTMYAILDSSTHTLSVRGLNGVSNDNFSLSSSGGQLLVQVNGTSERFNLSSIYSIDINAGEGNDTINIDNLQEPGLAVDVNGGDGADMLNIAGTSHFLDYMLADVVFYGGDGSDTMVLNDQVNANPDNFTVGTAITRPFFGSAFYDARTEFITLNAGSGDNEITVNYFDGTRLTINAAGGNDTVQLAPITQELGFITGEVYVRGSGTTSDHDRIILNDQAHTDAGHNWTFAADQVDRTIFGGLRYDFGIEEVELHAGNYSKHIQVDGTLIGPAGSVAKIYAGGGDDTIELSSAPTLLSLGGEVTDSFGSALQVFGESGNDRLIVHDEATAFDDNWTLRDNTIDKANVFSAQPLVTYGGIDAVEVHGGSGGTTWTVAPTIAGIGPAAPTKIFTGGGSDNVRVNAGEVTVDGQDALGGNDNVTVGAITLSSAVVHFNNTQRLGALVIGLNGSAVLEEGGGKVLSTSSLAISMSVPPLSFDAPGFLDLNDNAMIVRGGDLATVNGLLRSGFTDGGLNDWLGYGINSSVASAKNAGFGWQKYGLGVMRNDRTLYGGSAGPSYTSFAGESVSGGEILIKFTYTGDANLDGQVNIADLGLLSTYWQTAGAHWGRADFNFDGVVDVADLGLLSSNWQAGVVG